MAEFDFQIKHPAGSASVVPDVLSQAPLTHPSTSGEDLYFPPQAVTCFITTLIGFDIPYLEPSRVSEIFSDSLTCLTLACNPTCNPFFPWQHIRNLIPLGFTLVTPPYPTLLHRRTL